MKKGVLASLLLLLTTGCASTHHTELLSVSKDNDSKGQFSKVFVIAVSDDEALRNTVEKIVSDAISRRGATAIMSNTAIPGGIGSLSKDELRSKAEAAVKENGADSALVLLLLKDEVRDHYVAPVAQAAPAPSGPVYMGFGPYMGYNYDTVMTPGYFEQQREVFVQSSLFDTSNGNPVWRAQSKTVDPVDLKSNVEEFSKLMVTRLQQDGMLSAGAPAMRAGGY